MKRIRIAIEAVSWTSSLIWFVLAGLQSNWQSCFWAMVCAAVVSTEFPLPRKQ